MQAMYNRLDQVPQTLRHLHEQTSCLMLATAQSEQSPYVCHVPYVWADGGYYVWIADVTESMRHLREAGRASVMLLEQGHGQQCAQLVWIVQAHEVAHQSQHYQQLLPALAQAAGKSLQDACAMECQAIYHLQPIQGRLITDLNQIIALIAEDLHQAMAATEQEPMAQAVG